MEKQLLELFEEMVREIEADLPADVSWGAGSIWKPGSMAEIAKDITLYQFMLWLKGKAK